MGTVPVPSSNLCITSGVANGDICFLDRKRLEPKELLWPFAGQKGQNEAIQDNRAERATFLTLCFPWAGVKSRVEHARVVLGH